MARTGLLVLATALAAGTVGCAHCDICDDFPAPCNGPGCYGGAPVGPMTMTPGMRAVGPPMPVSNAGAGALGAPAAAPGGPATAPPVINAPPATGAGALGTGAQTEPAAERSDDTSATSPPAAPPADTNPPPNTNPQP
ncbi:MAG TPA: hypothetical protein VG406_26680 [Isosphaeraceae bacterium]|nr:hypothetical protein [Isosphaeraceae bacterium]